MSYRRTIPGLIPGIILCTLFITARGEQRKGKGETAVAADTQSVAVSFKRDIHPIFKVYCLPCHTEDRMNTSKLYLDTYDGLMEGGKHGKAVVPGRADSSLIIEKLLSPPPFGDMMPMNSKTPISVDTINVLRRWINQGAKDN